MARTEDTPQSDASGAEADPHGERPGEALRRAVERTLASTAEGAADTRRRAGELLDEVARRGVAAREEVTRRGEAAREEVTRRGEAARDEVSRRGEEASHRLAEALADLKLAEREDVGRLGDRIRELEARLGSLERLLRRDEAEPHGDAAQGGKTKAEVEGEISPDSTSKTASGGSDPQGTDTDSS